MPPEHPWPGGSPRPQPFEVAGTVRDRIAHVLRERILSGELERGARLDLDELAGEFRTSRTPVREAVLTLSHEGLTKISPRSRATVVGLTSQDVLDNFALMATLCGVAAQWAAERATDEDLDRIRTLGKQVAQASGDDLARLNWLFHREINRACRSTPLLNTLRNTDRLIPQTFFNLIPEQVACSLVEHEKLIRALVDRNPQRARTVTEAHFLNAGKLLSARFAAAQLDGVALKS